MFWFSVNDAGENVKFEMSEIANGKCMDSTVEKQ